MLLLGRARSAADVVIGTMRLDAATWRDSTPGAPVQLDVNDPRERSHVADRFPARSIHAHDALSTVDDGVVAVG